VFDHLEIETGNILKTLVYCVKPTAANPYAEEDDEYAGYDHPNTYNAEEEDYYAEYGEYLEFVPEEMSITKFYEVKSINQEVILRATLPQNFCY